MPFANAACLLKHFLKSLPAPLIPESLQEQVLEARNDSIELRYVISKVPKDERAILKALFELLNNLAFESRLDSNSAVELATVITPLVLWHAKRAADPDEEDLFMLKGVMAVGTLINRYDDVFEEVQPEVLAMKKDIGADHFDKLLAQLAGAAQVPAATAPKKPLPSLEDWAKELRSAPARPCTRLNCFFLLLLLSPYHPISTQLPLQCCPRRSCKRRRTRSTRRAWTYWQSLSTSSKPRRSSASLPPLLLPCWTPVALA